MSLRRRVNELEARVLHLERQLFGPRERVTEVRNGVPIYTSAPQQRPLKELPEWTDEDGNHWVDLGSGTSFRVVDGMAHFTTTPHTIDPNFVGPIPDVSADLRPTAEPPGRLSSPATPRPKVDHLFSCSQARTTPRYPKQPLRRGERWEWIPPSTTPGRWVITRDKD